jgi:gluconate 2-dehydrogenase alpha chain
MSYRQCYMDLDPTYKDAFGRPLLRLTFDWQDNEKRLMQHQTEVAAQIAKEMGAEQVFARREAVRHFSIVPYQTTHNTGGVVFGDEPHNSAVNKYLQSWDVPNLFVTGSTVFPQNAGYNPTGTIGALTYFALDAIKKQYLKTPGPLVQL